MTETEWLNSTDPAAMLAYLRHDERLTPTHRINDHQLRLWVEACREIRGGDDYSSTRLSDETRATILRDIVGNPFRPMDKRCRSLPLNPEQYDTNPREDWLTPIVLALARAAQEETNQKCERCMGTGDHNPGQSWHHYDRRSKHDDCPDCHGTGTIPTAELDRDRLLVLSDALEEAGCPMMEKCWDCQDESGYRIYCKTCEGSGCCGQLPHPILAHLRGPGPHWRGCHILTALLGE